MNLGKNLGSGTRFGLQVGVTISITSAFICFFAGVLGNGYVYFIGAVSALLTAVVFNALADIHRRTEIIETYLAKIDKR